VWHSASAGKPNGGIRGGSVSRSGNTVVGYYSRVVDGATQELNIRQLRHTGCDRQTLARLIHSYEVAFNLQLNTRQLSRERIAYAVSQKKLNWRI
jgi:hypothetical protein